MRAVVPQEGTAFCLCGVSGCAANKRCHFLAIYDILQKIPREASAIDKLIKNKSGALWRLGICAAVAAGILAAVWGYIAPYNKYVLQSSAPPADAVESLKDDWYLFGGFESELGETFAFERAHNGRLASDIKGYFVHEVIYCFMPRGVDYSRLRASFSFEGAVSVGSKKQISGWTANDFTHGVRYSIESGDGAVREYEVVILTSGLPTVQIDTVNGERVLAKTRYVRGAVSIYDGESVSRRVIPIEIRVRGNATAALPKLPYKFKTDNAQRLLALPESTDFVLLANYFDATLVRNKLAYEISRALGMRVVPEETPVDLIVNGEYCGVYALGNQIDVNAGSVDITPMTALDNEGEALTGGYLLELDGRLSEDMTNGFYTNAAVPVRIREPNEPTGAQFEYIESWINEFEACLFSEDFTYNGRGLSDYIDFDSFAAMYWTNELMKNTDFPYPMSFFVYKDRLGKLTAGPVWDFDIAAGNYPLRPEATDPTGWFINTNTWFARLLECEAFVGRVKAMYYENEAWISGIPDYIDELTAQMASAESNNYIRTYIGLNEQHQTPETDTYDADVLVLKTWFEQRLKWISENIDEYCVTLKEAPVN